MPARRLTIAQLVPSLESGGVERGTLEVARELVRQGHRSIVISGGGRLIEQLVAEGSEHVEWPIGRKSPLTLACVPKLRSWVCAQRVDVVHARSRVPAWVAWLAWKSLPVARRPRFVTTVHGLYSVNAYSRIMTRGERVVAVSEAVRDYITAGYPQVPTERIVVIPRGVDPVDFPFGFRPSEDWMASWSAQHPQLHGRRVLTLAGRITRLKGHHDFLTLLARLKSEQRNVHGLIVGDEDPRRQQYAAEVRQRVIELGLDGDVTFLGHRSDIREIYAVSSAVLSLSTKPESFGRTTLEPLSLGIPVIGYGHGGVGEILSTIFPPGAVPLGDQDVLADRVRSLLSVSDVRVKPFAAFRLQHMLDRTLDLYTSLTAEADATPHRRAAA